MFQDGGVKLINFLLSAAVSSADAKKKKSLMSPKSMTGTSET
jgi:hypothetical protein